MREILFRAKSIITGEWFEGFYREWVIMGLNRHIICLPNGKAFNGSDVVVIDPETLGQYTGLGDMTGTKIFEGDIIRFYDEENNSEDGTVFWNGECSGFCVEWVSGDVGALEPFDSENSEVIGNKWDGASRK